jgi:hypothetical protein
MRLLTLSSRSTLVIAVTAIGIQSAVIPPVHAQVATPRSTATVAAADPIDAAVTEASRRFGVPEHWIRAVMRQESNGEVRAVSSAGAMGLMQVMPGTYAELRSRYGLGADPFAIRDNVLAGTAYLREMHDRYGGLGMLAAYNAGPGRWEAYRAGVRPLPRETIGYIARLGAVLDVGSIPADSVVARPILPSPLASPIFVALTNLPDAGSTPSAAVASRVIMASSTPLPASSEALFVRRSTAVPPATEAQPGDPRTSTERAVETPTAAPLRRSEQPADSLFPLRPRDDRR